MRSRSGLRDSATHPSPLPRSSLVLNNRSRPTRFCVRLHDRLLKQLLHNEFASLMWTGRTQRTTLTRNLHFGGNNLTTSVSRRAYPSGYRQRSLFRIFFGENVVEAPCAILRWVASDRSR